MPEYNVLPLERDFVYSIETSLGAGAHIDYPKIERLSSLKEEELNKLIKLNLRWEAREKVHGANFSIITDGKTVAFNKRTLAIRFDLGETFNGIAGDHKLIKQLRNKAMLLHSVYKKQGWLVDTNDLVIFGELCGGFYSGQSVDSRIQKGVQYSPDIRFLVFEVWPFVDKNPTHNYINDFFETVPWVTSGDLESVIEAIKIPQKSTAYHHSLVSLPDNIMEGVVLTAWDYKHGTLFRYKHHNEGFAEKKQASNKFKSTKVHAILDERRAKEVEDIALKELSVLIGTRKVDSSEIPVILKNMNLRVWVQLNKGSDCDKDEEKLINKKINQLTLNYLKNLLS